MDEWMIRWAFMAPFVTVGTEFCGLIVLLALAGYGLASLPLRVRGRWEWSWAMGMSMLIGFATLALLMNLLGPFSVELFSDARKFAAVGFLIVAFIPLLVNLKVLGRWLLRVWDSLFGISCLFAFIGCGPYFAVLGANASPAGWPRLIPLAAYALGMLMVMGLWLLLVAGTHHLLTRRFHHEEELRPIRVIGLLGAMTAGLLGLGI